MMGGLSAWRRRAVAAVLAALCGCTVGPNFRPPASPSTTAYLPRGERDADDAGPVPRQTIVLGRQVRAEWWRLFRSPALDGLLAQAIAGSLTLQGAQARLAEAREVVAENASGLEPQASFGASATRGKLSPTSFGLSPSAFPLPPNYNVFQIGPTASYDLDLFGGRRRQVEEQTALAAYQGYQLDAAYLTLTSNTASQAVLTATLRAQVKATDETLAIDRQNLALVEAERQAGSVPDSDVVLAQSQLAADETLQPGLLQQASAARHALAVLVGQAPGDWSPPDFDLAGLVLPGALPVSVPSELVRRRPDILAAEAQLHAASAQIGVATAQLYPDVTLSGAVSGAALDPGHLFSPTALVWSIAAGLTQPLFDGGLRRARRREALASFRAAAADYRLIVLQAFQQVADVLQALTHDTQLLDDEQHALDTASESVHLQQLSYSEGGSGILALLEAQRQYQQALLGYIRADGQLHQDTIALLAAMGGGWQGGALPGTPPGAGPLDRL